MHHKIFTIKKQIFFLYTDKIGNVEAYLVSVNRWLKIFAGKHQKQLFLTCLLGETSPEKSTPGHEAGGPGPARLPGATGGRRSPCHRAAGDLPWACALSFWPPARQGVRPPPGRTASGRPPPLGHRPQGLRKPSIGTSSGRLCSGGRGPAARETCTAGGSFGRRGCTVASGKLPEERKQEGNCFPVQRARSATRPLRRHSWRFRDGAGSTERRDWCRGRVAGVWLGCVEVGGGGRDGRIF